MKRGNYIVVILCVALTILIFVVTADYPSGAKYGTGVSGPAFWPRIVSCVMTLCSMWLSFQTLMMKPEDDSPIAVWARGNKRVYLCIAVLFTYLQILRPLGFFISTSVALFVFFIWFSEKKRNPVFLFFLSIVSSAAVYVPFRYLLNVSLGFGLFAP
jgi:hypothetical protein